MYCSKMVLVSGNKRHIHVKLTPSKYSKQESKTSTITVDDYLHDTEKTFRPLAQQKLYFPEERSYQDYPERNLDDYFDAPKTSATERLQSITEDVFEESFDNEEESFDICYGMRKLETSFTGLQLSPEGSDKTTVSKVHEVTDKKSDQEGSQNKEVSSTKQIKTRRKSVRLLEKKAEALKGECEKVNPGQGILSSREALKRVDVQVNNLSSRIMKDTAGAGKYAKSYPPQESLKDIDKEFTKSVRGSVKFKSDLFDHNDSESDHDNFQDKSINRRRSSRLVSKAKIKEETSNRRRSVRLIRNRE